MNERTINQSAKTAPSNDFIDGRRTLHTCFKSIPASRSMSTLSSVRHVTLAWPVVLSLRQDSIKIVPGALEHIWSGCRRHVDRRAWDHAWYALPGPRSSTGDGGQGPLNLAGRYHSAEGGK